ncbi:MAG: hypothetical protein F6K30_14300 [Cyanothece sp. SIO2G6]|nr:hypothetical protein [Cyanothece sp. SIO2G6]
MCSVRHGPVQEAGVARRLAPTPWMLGRGEGDRPVGVGRENARSLVGDRFQFAGCSSLFREGDRGMVIVILSSQRVDGSSGLPGCDGGYVTS